MAAGDGPTERPPLSHEVRLTLELLERARTHPCREGLPLGRRLEQGFGTGAGSGAPGGHGPMVARSR